MGLGLCVLYISHTGYLGFLVAHTYAKLILGAVIDVLENITRVIQQFYVDQNYSNDHVKKLQQRMLRHFCGLRIELTYAGNLGPTNKGFEGSGASYIHVIGNPPAANVLTKLLREDLRCLPSRMGIFLAMRRLDQIDMLLERDFPFEVELLFYPDRKKRLSKIALDNAKVLLLQGMESVDVVEIVEIWVEFL
ncbi:hypothetical protein SUGI_0854440 [Cryptomeria japonica]|nr:hypothetical protein SUGI_0854440 [Cryptomeria japonica]